MLLLFSFAQASIQTQIRHWLDLISVHALSIKVFDCKLLEAQTVVGDVADQYGCVRSVQGVLFSVHHHMILTSG